MTGLGLTLGHGELYFLSREQNANLLELAGFQPNVDRVAGKIADFLRHNLRNHDPRVLVLDEPTVGLDPRQIVAIRELIRELGQKHTLLLSTHILPEVELLCRRVLIIDRGRIVAEGSPEELRQRWIAEGKEPFRIGIGVNTDPMVVGNLGSEQLFDYTVIGDGVNIGARLESLNKEYKTTHAIIISESTYAAARDAIEARPLGEVTVKGKTRPLKVYELLGLKSAALTSPAP